MVQRDECNLSSEVKETHNRMTRGSTAKSEADLSLNHFNEEMPFKFWIRRITKSLLNIIQ